jgi:lipid-binding SYLF domain-containing protein
MKTSAIFSSSLRRAVLLSLAAALLTAPLARAGDAPGVSKATLVKQVADDGAFYQSLQFDPDTIVPNWVVAHAKGVLILDRGPAPASTNGQAIGLLKVSGKKFSAPAFYVLGSGATGVQNPSASVHLVAFLMTDQAVRSLSGTQSTWSGLHAVAGDPNSTAAPAGALPDVIIFQNGAKLDPAALVSATTVSANPAINALYYDNPGITPADIFSGKVDIPDAAAPLVEAFNQQASMPN